MKKVMWENWNEKEKELFDTSFQDQYLLDTAEEEDEQILSMANKDDGHLFPPIIDMQPQVIHTPFGVVPSDSILKPSDRWECWLAYTNFDLTHKISDRIKIINGVEALKMMSRYTFCVGIGKLFNHTRVKKEIEDAICK
jgi:hypothetical protein